MCQYFRQLKGSGKYPSPSSLQSATCPQSTVVVVVGWHKPPHHYKAGHHSQHLLCRNTSQKPRRRPAGVRQLREVGTACEKLFPPSSHSRKSRPLYLPPGRILVGTLAH